MDASKPPLGRRMKPRAPPPPQAPQAPQAPQPAPRRLLRVADSQDGAGDREMKENMLSRTVELRLTLPTGHQTTVTEDGSKALMDVLVELCSCYHLNPSLHTLELFTPEGQSLGFKPNVLLGSLNVACVLIKEKVLEERQVRRSAPKVPEKTVRLLVNYHGSQKAVVRVNPLLPLQELVPIVCDKCEFDPALVVLLKDSISRQKLPLDETLSTLGIKELYVHDKSLVLQPKMASAPALNLTDCLRYSTNSLARAEKKGLLGMFQFGRRKSKTETTSLDMEDYNDTETHSKALSSMYGSQFSEERLPMSQSHSAMNISRTSPKADAKKRRAPAPPGIPSHSTEHLNSDANMMGLGSDTEQRKRKAPAPPPTPPSLSYDSEDFSATATPVSQHNQAIASESTTLTTTVEIDAIKPVTPSTVHLKQSAICLEIRSSTPSSITSDSLIAQDSSSELSPSLEESDASSQTEKSEGSTNISASDMTTASSSRSDTVSAMNLKMEETKNNRHSGVVYCCGPVRLRGKHP
uniref:Cordon-bleu ubiquitin-like domain-containing protein n=1 Tax=Knipowitschia caucasica TaxID=637954 RepID=A0AAV2MBK0_KNICA